MLTKRGYVYTLNKTIIKIEFFQSLRKLKVID